MAKFTFDPRDSILPYRKTLGLVVVNPANEVLVGQWPGLADISKMPDGTYEEGDDLFEAALRILGETTGITEVVIERESLVKVRCDYPAGSDDLQGFRGRQFTWVMVRTPNAILYDDAINDHSDAPHMLEGLRWRSAHVVTLLAHNGFSGNKVTAAHSEIYREVLAECGLLAKPAVVLKSAASIPDEIPPKAKVDRKKDVVPAKDFALTIQSLPWTKAFLSELATRPQAAYPEIAGKLEELVTAALTAAVLKSLNVPTDPEAALKAVRAAYHEIGRESALRRRMSPLFFWKQVKQEISHRVLEIRAAMPVEAIPSVPKKKVASKTPVPKAKPGV